MKKLYFNPYKGVDWQNYNHYKSNLHTHTTESDGSLYGADVIDNYKSADYDILILADHDSFRPSRSPRELGGVTFINVWDWTIFEGEEEYQADVGSYTRLLEETENQAVSGVANNNMLCFEGCEYSNIHHIGSFDNKFPGMSGNTVDNALNEDYLRGSLSMFYHPGRYSYSPQWYADFYLKYPNLIGLEVFNQGDRYPNDRQKCDEINNITMPYRPVFYYSNDDMHTSSHLFRNFNTILMPDLNRTEFYKALKKGASFAHYQPNGSGSFEVPKVNNIIINEEESTIEIIAENFDAIQWIENNTVIATGEIFDFKNTQFNKYIRARLLNSNGETLVQPFSFLNIDIDVPEPEPTTKLSSIRPSIR